MSSLADGLAEGEALAFFGFSFSVLFRFLVPTGLLPSAGGTGAALAEGLTVALGLTVADGVVVVPVQAASVVPRVRMRRRLID